MARLHSTANNYIPPGASKTLHTAPGKVHAIVATGGSATPAQLTLYDSPTASGDLLAVFEVSANAPLTILYPPPLGLIFLHGLTVVCGANCRAHLITEA
ncbi:MAG: hypothetical protein QME21_10060 [Anaerolineales bacterium]|nr:hypothetical protein [Anaerolineales bacterium]